MTLAGAAAAALLAVAIAAASAGGAKQVRIGLVLGQPLSRSADPVEYDEYRGLLRAERRLGVQVKAVVPSPNFPYDPAPFDYLAGQRYDLVVASGYVGGLSEAAHRFRKVKFAAIGSARRQLRPAAGPNVEGTVFRAEQPAYLAGFVAARMADRMGPAPHVVSSVGGFPTPQVQALIAGFQAGARRADPKIRVLNSYALSFTDAARCANVALNQIVAHHSRVVFNVAGACGRGALEAAKSKGVYGIGVDVDESYLGRFILTSVVIRWNRAVYALAKLAAAGRLPTGGDLSWNMLHHYVGLGRFSRKVPRSLRRRLRPLARAIEHGKIVVPSVISAPH
jgi:basic membrane protein A